MGVFHFLPELKLHAQFFRQRIEISIQRSFPRAPLHGVAFIGRHRIFLRVLINIRVLNAGKTGSKIDPHVVLDKIKVHGSTVDGGMMRRDTPDLPGSVQYNDLVTLPGQIDGGYHA